MKRIFAVTALIVVFGSYNGFSQEKPKEDPKLPILSSEVKKDFTIAMKGMENAQLKAQLAESEFQRARLEFQQLMKDNQKEGYDLDIQTLTYKKKGV